MLIITFYALLFTNWDIHPHSWNKGLSALQILYTIGGKEVRPLESWKKSVKNVFFLGSQKLS